MGVFNCKISVSNLEGSDLQEIDAPVDTGATYTVLPTHLLHELGISPMRKGPFVMGDGRRGAMDIGHGWITINGTKATTTIIIGSDDASPLLGEVTLEELQLAVEPVAGRLVPTHSIWY